MSALDQFYAALVYIWAKVDKDIVSAFLLAFTVSSLVMWQRKRYELSEALLCGVFAGIAVISLGFIGNLMGMQLPLEASSIISGAIGWYGTKRTVHFVEQRVGGSRNDSN